MGASESTLSSSQQLDQNTTVTEKPEDGVDPLLEQLRSLKIITPILTSIPTENSLTDILGRRPSPSSAPGTLNPKMLLELFSIQEDIENKIELIR
ncbi:hypothetical protein MKX01_036785 [Papaver californicum]|nr:hypothetical protein MKX01_036785 [Papaver californicum]